jgi:hypothetical protein
MGGTVAAVGAKRWKPLIVGVAVAWTFWLIGGSLLLASWRSNVGAERARNAPICAPGQVFSRAECRVTVAGDLTKFTSSVMVVTVGGRSISSGVTINGSLPGTSPAISVEVTIYRGRVIHVEGAANLTEDAASLSVDTDAAPATRSWNYRNFGFCFLVFGTAVGIYSAVDTGRKRGEPDQDPPYPGPDMT